MATLCTHSLTHSSKKYFFCARFAQIFMEIFSSSKFLSVPDKNFSSKPTSKENFISRRISSARSHVKFLARNFFHVLDGSRKSAFFKRRFFQMFCPARFSAQICSTLAKSLRDFAPSCAIFERSTSGTQPLFSHFVRISLFFLV